MNESARPAEPAAPAERIAAWRASGAHRRDPVRFRHIEAMARRATAYDGQARRRLDARLAELIARYEAALCAPAAAPHRVDIGAGTGTGAGQAVASPLKALLDDLAHEAARQVAPGPAASGAAPTPGGAAPEELKAVRYFKRTWTRLSADQRLTQALAKVPENAGPLNSNHLVHRALLLMREISPEYLHRFITHVDALLWLDDLQRAAFAGKAASRGDGADKKPARGRGG